MNGSDVQIQIGAKINAGGAATGAEETISQIDRIAEKTVAATAQTVAADREATAAVQTLTAAQHEAAAVAQLYQTNVATAERALAILGATTGDAMENMVALDAAMDQAQAEAVKAAASTAAYNLELKQTAAAAIAAAEAEEKQSAMSEALSAALVRVGISEADVAAMATKMSISLEVAGRAMIQIKQAALADEVTAARLAIEALNAPTVAVAQAQEDLGEAAVAAGGKTTNSFGRGSPAFHAMVAASNVSRGGAIAMRGWMEVAELVGVAFGGIMGPVILVSAVLGELIARYEEHKNKGKESAGEVKDAFDKMAAAFDHFQGEVDTFNLKKITDGLREYLQLQREINALQNAQDEAAAARIKDDLDRADAQEKLALAKLNAEKGQELAQAGDDPIKKAQIDADYAEKEAQVKRQYIKDKTDFQLSENEREQEANRNQQAALVMNAEDARKKNDAAQAKARSSAADAADAGYAVVPDGTFADAKKVAEDRLKQAGDANNAAQQKLKNADAGLEESSILYQTGISPTNEGVRQAQNRVHEAQDEADAAYQAFHTARNNIGIIGQAEIDRAAAADTAKHLEATLDNSVALAKLTSALTSLIAKQELIIPRAQTERLDVDTEAQKATGSAENTIRTEQTKDQRTIRDANLQTQIDALDRQMKETADHAALKRLGDQKAQLEEQQVQNETADKQAGYAYNPAVAGAIGAEGTAKAAVVVAGQDQRDAKDDTKVIAEEIRQATAQIETSHNPEAIAEMRKFIATAQGVPQQQSLLLQELVGLMKEMTQSQTGINSRVERDIGDIHSRLKWLGGQ